MPGEYSGSAVIDRPIAEVFEFLAAGTNDPKFSPRVLEIRRSLTVRLRSGRSS